MKTYYECRGAPLVVEASFINSNPWMIPINVANLSASSLVYLPKVIVVYGKEYQLGGFSMYSTGHYTAVIEWNNKHYFYDGLPSTNEQRLQPLS